MNKEERAGTPSVEVGFLLQEARSQATRLPHHLGAVRA